MPLWVSSCFRYGLPLAEKTKGTTASRPTVRRWPRRPPHAETCGVSLGLTQDGRDVLVPALCLYDADATCADEERIVSGSALVGHSAIAMLRPFAGRVPRLWRSVSVSTSQPRLRSCWSMMARVACSSISRPAAAISAWVMMAALWAGVAASAAVCWVASWRVRLDRADSASWASSPRSPGPHAPLPPALPL